MGMIEGISEEWGIMDQDQFKDLLVENLTLQASLNFEENGDPILGEKQFEDLIVRSATEYTVEEMVEEGILIKGLDKDGLENSYRINPEIDLEDDEEDNN
jgi:hypothetical protein